jgi:tRNA (guanine37-N1)-methyltransferase
MKLVDRKARIRLEGETLLLPLLRKPSSDEATRIEVRIGPVLVSEDAFGPKTKTAQSLEEALENELPPSLIASLPASFDVVGDIAVVEFLPELSHHERVVAEGILKVHKNLKAVFARAGPVSGVDRVRPLRHLVGDRRTTTVHREFGCRYKVDLSKAYFSPRLSTEHQRVAESVEPGEFVVDMFAGVGPFSILIAKRRGDVVVHAVDSNPEAVRLLRDNVRLNKQEGKVTVWAGDARAIVERDLRGKASRVIMNLPSAAKEFVDVACRALHTEGGVLHYYTFADGLDYKEKALGELERSLSSCSWRLRTKIGVRPVRGVGPMHWQVVVDARVVPMG